MRRYKATAMATIAAGALFGAAHAPALAQSGSSDAPAPVDRTFQGSLLREGAFLTSASGRIVRSSDDAWVFRFFPDGDGRRLPPMVVLPCMNLAAMEQIAESRSEQVTFVVSGQVFVYQDRNYLLPTSHGVLSLDESDPVEQSGDDAADNETNDESSPSAALPEELIGGEEPSPEVSDLIESLDESTPQRRPLAPAPAGADSKGPALVREGTMRTLRRGMVMRDSASLVFATESGVEDPVRMDPPMILMPCRNLEEIESLLQRAESPMEFRISGRVFVYQDKNYLLPTMYVVAFDRGGNLVSGQ